jgi:hypothetical protein
LPAYVLTGDTFFSSEATRPLNFQKTTQWQADGSNAFTSTYYNSQYSVHTACYGGWDFHFDFTWTDAYGYQWSLHEPDHHVNGVQASNLINAYEILRDTA